jgi:hypothetical protein
MTADYSFWADALSKFQTSTPIIQALWLIAIAATFSAMAFAICWWICGVATVVARRRPLEPIGQTLYSVARMEDGQLRVFGHAPELVELSRDALFAETEAFKAL